METTLTIHENRRILISPLTGSFRNFEEVREWVKFYAPVEAGWEIDTSEITTTTDYTANGESRYVHYRVKKTV